jgi:hypothetical protein
MKGTTPFVSAWVALSGLLLVLQACDSPIPTEKESQHQEQRVVAYTCNDLPAAFSSYHDAISQVRAATFPIHDVSVSVNSSWIRGYSFHSCDGALGYFIVRTDKDEYIHQNVPLSVFQGFTSASSLGRYYNQRIKGNYGM